jgi:hypothetical protein
LPVQVKAVATVLYRLGYDLVDDALEVGAIDGVWPVV